MANNVANKMDYGWLFSKLFTYKFQIQTRIERNQKLKNVLSN